MGRGANVVASVCGGSVLGCMIFNAWWGAAIGAFAGLFLSIYLNK